MFDEIIIEKKKNHDCTFNSDSFSWQHLVGIHVFTNTKEEKLSTDLWFTLFFKHVFLLVFYSFIEIPVVTALTFTGLDYVLHNVGSSKGLFILVNCFGYKHKLSCFIKINFSCFTLPPV